MPAAARPRVRHWLAVLTVVLAAVGLVAAIGPRRSSAGATPGAAPPVPATSTTSHEVGALGWVSVEAPPGPGPHPVLLHVPGGGWATLDPSPVGRAFGHDQALEQGWAVATVGYPTGPDVTARDQVAAVLAALRWVRGLGGPMVASGHSAGAHLLATAVGQAAPADRPDALVLVAGVYDLAGDVRSSPMLVPGLAEGFGCHDGACPGTEDLEPRRAAAADLPPTVLVHGRADHITPAAGSERYAAALVAAGAPVELHLVEAGRHRGHGTDAAARRALADLLAEVLGGGADQARDARSNR